MMCFLTQKRAGYIAFYTASLLLEFHSMVTRFREYPARGGSALAYGLAIGCQQFPPL